MWPIGLVITKQHGRILSTLLPVFWTQVFLECQWWVQTYAGLLAIPLRSFATTGCNWEPFTPLPEVMQKPLATPKSLTCGSLLPSHPGKHLVFGTIFLHTCTHSCMRLIHEVSQLQGLFSLVFLRIQWHLLWVTNSCLAMGFWFLQCSVQVRHQWIMSKYVPSSLPIIISCFIGLLNAFAIVRFLVSQYWGTYWSFCSVFPVNGLHNTSHIILYIAFPICFEFFGLTY